MWPLLFLCFTSIIDLSLQQASSTDTFIQPGSGGKTNDFSQDVLLPLGSNYTIKWITFSTDFSIWLWQNYYPPKYNYGSECSDHPIFTKAPNQDDPRELNWTVTYQDWNIEDSNVFFFSAGPNCSLSSSVFTSNYFNITPAASSQKPSPSSGSTSNGTKDNLGQKIGIGVGVGVGVLIILVLCAFLFMRYRKNKAKNRVQLLDNTDISPTKIEELSDNNPSYGRHELPNTSASPVYNENNPSYGRHEMPSASVTPSQDTVKAAINSYHTSNWGGEPVEMGETSPNTPRSTGAQRVGDRA